MIAHLKDRAAALAALGWTGSDAEWLAVVCLQSGAFLRSQYLTFTGASHPSAAARFIHRCRPIAAEEAWNGTRVRLCRIVARSIYRALGAEPIRHRWEATTAFRLRRLLAFDYVLDHPDRAWLPTEDDKVTTLTAAGVPETALPRRVYPGPGQGHTRYFVHKLPVALEATHGTFVFVQGPDDTPSALHTWGTAHAVLWAALRAQGRAVAVVVVGHDRDPLDGAKQILRKWASAAPTGPEATELAAIRAAIETTDVGALARYSGLQGALRQLVELEARATARAATGDEPLGTPRISSGSVWRSSRVVV